MKYLNLDANKEVILAVHEGAPLYLRGVMGPNAESFIVEHVSVLGQTRIVEMRDSGRLLEPVELSVGDRLRVRRTPEDAPVLLDLGRDLHKDTSKFVAFGSGGARVCEVYEG